MWHPTDIDEQLIRLALQEDLGLPYFDATTKLLFAEHNVSSEANIISKHSSHIILSGLNLLPLIAAEFNSHIKIQTHYQDGDIIPPGAVIATLAAPASVLLTLERTILNFMRHLSGIATLTKQFVELVKHTPCKILDTRKTTPGLRHLEKYAVQCGGGVNHRQGLYDAIMIKDTHVDLLGNMEQALAKLPLVKSLPVIVEVRNLTELKQVLANRDKIDRVLLDNMRGELLQQAVQLCQAKLVTEASGNLTLENIVSVAETGVDFASIGMLTHSAGQVDLSMKIG